uniref:Uncharacterized protein n=1 Tax=Knipowitschia caucasica TaxID=637954 RepID=A0AAV2LAN5_KNICA
MTADQIVQERDDLQLKVDELKEFLEQRDTLIDYGKEFIKKREKEIKLVAREFQNQMDDYEEKVLEKQFHLENYCMDLQKDTLSLREQLDTAEQLHLQDEARNMKLETEISKMKKLQQQQEQTIQELQTSTQELQEELDEAEKYHIIDAVENIKNVGELAETKIQLKKSEAENKALKTSLQQADRDAETKDQTVAYLKTLLSDKQTAEEAQHKKVLQELETSFKTTLSKCEELETSLKESNDELCQTKLKWKRSRTSWTKGARRREGGGGSVAGSNHLNITVVGAS